MYFLTQKDTKRIISTKENTRQEEEQRHVEGIYQGGTPKE